MNKSKSLLIVTIIALIATLGAAWYFLWYIPRTPIYTFQIIRQGIDERNPDKVMQHIDVTALVNNIVTREGNTYVDPTTPWGKAAIGATKVFGPALLEDVIRKYVEDPDSFKSPPLEGTETTNASASSESTQSTFSMIDRLQRGELFKQHTVEVKNITSIEDNGIATVTVTLQNNRLHMTEDVRVLLKYLGDGKWAIYDIPDIETLYRITRK